jgi:hypothetical protein
MLKQRGLQLQPCRKRRCAARVIDLPDLPQKVLLCEGRPWGRKLAFSSRPKTQTKASNIKSTALKTLGFPNSQEIERQPRLPYLRLSEISIGRHNPHLPDLNTVGT